MISNDRPYCDECRKELLALTEEEAEADSCPGHGWSDWKTARKHLCYGCQDNILEACGWPPCGECATQPCERGRDCWADGRYPSHAIPYETYIADLRRKPLHVDQRILV